MSPRHPSSSTLRRAEAATWGPRPSAEPDRKRMLLIEWRPVLKGALRGFAAIELPMGLRILDVAVFASNGRTWANLPAKPQLDRDGQHKLGPDGKPAYVAILEWRSRELSNRFSEAVVTAVLAAHAEALNGDGAP